MVDRIPYMIIIGQKEVETNTISVRNRDTSKTETMLLDEFVKKITSEIQNRV